MPFFNVRILVITLLVVLLVAGGVYGWVWYQGRPDTLYKSAQDYYEKAEKLREAKDTAKARAAYEKGQTAIEQFLTKITTQDPRASQAYVLKYKILRPLASIVKSEGETADSKELKVKAIGL